MRHLILFLLLFTAGRSTTFYLEAGASGTNSGTLANPWKTVSAISGIGNGDTLLIQGGDYSTEEIGISLKTNVTYKINPAATQQAIFRGIQIYTSPGAVFDGYLGADNGILDITKCMIKTIGITNNNNSLLVRETAGFTIRGCELDQTLVPAVTTQHGIAIGSGNCSAGIIEYNYIHHTVEDAINDNHTSASPDPTSYTNIVIRYNRIFYTGDDGIQCKGWISVYGNYIDNDEAPTFGGGHPDGIQIQQDQNYVKIYNNTFKSFNQNIFVEFADGTTGGCFVYNNALIGTRNGDGASKNTDHGITYSTRGTFTATFLICNNVSYNFKSFIAFNGGINAGATRIIRNNVFYNCKFIASGGETGPFGADNLYFNAPGVQYYDTSGNPVSIPSDQVVGSASYGDPGFVNVTGYDFHAASGVALIVGTGTDTSAYFTVDKDGVTRTVPWDRGVFKYGGPPFVQSSAAGGAIKFGGSSSLH